MDIIGALANGAVGGLLGGIGTLAKDIRQAITGELPAEKQAEIEVKLLELQNIATTAQTRINEIEAASESLFVAGWRPFVGWVCGFALAYNYVAMPLIVWTVKCFYEKAPDMPLLETSELYTLLGGMLGLGWLRSKDKALAPAPLGKE